MLLNSQGAKYNDTEPVPGTEKTVLNGELLVEHQPADQPFNYRLYHDPNIFLTCEKESIAHLSTDEFLLLVPVKNRGDRLSVFRTKLSWGISLTEGSTVNVSIKIPGRLAVKRDGKAVIRYRGKIGNKEGMFFGVEILVRPKLMLEQ